MHLALNREMLVVLGAKTSQATSSYIANLRNALDAGRLPHEGIVIWAGLVPRARVGHNLIHAIESALDRGLIPTQSDRRLLANHHLPLLPNLLGHQHGKQEHLAM